jgi:hypothetical protein
VIAVRAARLATVLRVLDRVEATTPAGVTCTVGVTRWEPDETAEEASRRSREALQEALRARAPRVGVALTR